MCAASGGRLRLLSTRGDPPREMTLELQCRTAASAAYPRDVSARTNVRIQFSARYPFEPPLAEILTPIYHPNVYGSGRVCLGTHWLPTEGLDLLVKRIAQIITFDPSIVNAVSAANPAAASWYRSAVLAHPHAFPTDQMTFDAADAPERKVQWRDLSAAAKAETARGPASQSRGPTSQSWGPAASAEASAPRPSAGSKVVACTSCSQALRVPDRSGVRTRCPKCGHTFAVAS
jgi:hypothetical protein